MAREWIVFAICLGVGGHIAFAVILHRPDLWPWSNAWLYGLLSSVALYVLVQVVRALWWVCRGRSGDGSESRGEQGIGHL
ncbi:MAG: exported protein of unknown function [Nitrospira sp.]|jgi:hypothetical protein|nr:exported protein of unknown function [Nitrospira sp.]